jgi:hypothetical protein
MMFGAERNLNTLVSLFAVELFENHLIDKVSVVRK